MFGSCGPLQIGDANIEAVVRALRAAGIRVAAQDVGGNRGRRVTFECDGRRHDRRIGRPTRQNPMIQGGSETCHADCLSPMTP